jgi:hypothetical protein
VHRRKKRAKNETLCVDEKHPLDQRGNETRCNGLTSDNPDLSEISEARSENSESMMADHPVQLRRLSEKPFARRRLLVAIAKAD